MPAVVQEGPSKAIPVSVIVPHWQDHSSLSLLLESLRNEGAGEIIVVDDGSDPPPRVPDGVRLIRGRSRIGAAARRNQGAMAAVYDKLAFIDSDCLPSTGWLLRGAQALDEHPVAYGPYEKYFMSERPSIAERFNYHLEIVMAAKQHMGRSANLFMRKQVFTSIGGWCEKQDNSEDKVIFGRIDAAGVIPYYDPGLFVRHRAFTARERLRRIHRAAWRRRCTGMPWHELALVLVPWPEHLRKIRSASRSPVEFIGFVGWWYLQHLAFIWYSLTRPAGPVPRW